MKFAATSAVFVSALVGMPVLAGEEANNPLFGMWHITSITIQTVGEEGQPRDAFGPNPHGYLVLTPEHRILAFLAAADRKPAKNDAEAAALLRSMFAYAGKFELEPGKWTTTVEFSSSQVNNGAPQIRYYSVEGDKLIVRTPEQTINQALGDASKRAVFVVTAERDK